MTMDTQSLRGRSPPSMEKTEKVEPRRTCRVFSPALPSFQRAGQGGAKSLKKVLVLSAKEISFLPPSFGKCSSKLKSEREGWLQPLVESASSGIRRNRENQKIRRKGLTGESSRRRMGSSIAKRRRSLPPSSTKTHFLEEALTSALASAFVADFRFRNGGDVLFKLVSVACA